MPEFRDFSRKIAYRPVLSKNRLYRCQQNFYRAYHPFHHLTPYGANWCSTERVFCNRGMGGGYTPVLISPRNGQVVGSSFPLPCDIVATTFSVWKTGRFASTRVPLDYYYTLLRGWVKCDGQLHNFNTCPGGTCPRVTLESLLL